MSVIGFHCSHEQIPPSTLLRDVIPRRPASDHLAPWLDAQGESGFALAAHAAALPVPGCGC